MKYMAKNGLPGMDSIYGDDKFAISDFIEHLGDLMDTDEVDGTSFETAYDVMSEWVVDRSDVIVFNSFFGPDWTWGKGAIRDMIASGSIVRIGYGKYYKIGSSWVRSGGHSVLAPGYAFVNSGNFLFVADPNSTWNDPGGIDNQGDFRYDGKKVQDVTLTTDDYGQLTHAMYGDAIPADFVIPAMKRMIDSMHAMTPVWAGWSETEVFVSKREGSAGDGSVRTIMPFQLNNTEFTPHELIPHGEVVDWVYDLASAGIYYVNKIGQIYYFDMVTGDDKLIHVVKGASALMVGGTTNDLFVLVKGEPNDSLFCFERDDMHLEQDQVPDQMRKVEKSLPGHGVAMEFDPVSGGPAVLASGLNIAWAFDEKLAPQENLTMPPLEPGTRKVIFKIDHLTGDILMAREGDTAYWKKQRRGETVKRSPRLSSGITTLIPTEGHRLLIQDGNTLQTYDQGGNLVTTQFSNLVVGGPVKMVRSNFAAKRGTMTGPKWRNLDPSEVLD